MIMERLWKVSVHGHGWTWSFIVEATCIQEAYDTALTLINPRNEVITHVEEVKA